MNFVFPKNKVNHFGVIKTTVDNSPPIFLDSLNPKDNLITIDKVDYAFTYFHSSGKAKGGNSIILKLYEMQNLDLDDLEYGEPDLILKISKFVMTSNPRFETKSEKRFKKEIQALQDCKSKKFQNIITIYHHGVCSIFSTQERKKCNYLYYTMEYAGDDLKTYIENRLDLTLFERVDLCLSLAKGLNELDSLGYYHRDIKPDNIFMVGDEWKIADLGLVDDERSGSLQIDDENELIGPRGWYSPEAMNKYLCEGKGFCFDYDCKIDHQSDIFQLGMVFSYIIQNSNPVGVFRQKDLNIKNPHIYQLIRTMMNYPKSRRYKKISEVIDFLKPIQSILLRTG